MLAHSYQQWRIYPAKPRENVTTFAYWPF